MIVTYRRCATGWEITTPGVTCAPVFVSLARLGEWAKAQGFTLERGEEQ